MAGDNALDESALAMRTGSALRGAREKSGLSMREVARRAGISQPFLSQLERGQSMPSMITLYRLADALSTTPGDLMPSSTGDSVVVVRRDEGEFLPVADRPNAAIGRIMVSAPDRSLQINEYNIEPGQFIGEWFEGPGLLALYVVSGELDVVVEGAGTYRIGAGDLITHPGRLRHRWLLVDGAAVRLVLVTAGRE